MLGRVQGSFSRARLVSPVYSRRGPCGARGPRRETVAVTASAASAQSAIRVAAPSPSIPGPASAATIGSAEVTAEPLATYGPVPARSLRGGARRRATPRRGSPAPGRGRQPSRPACRATCASGTLFCSRVAPPLVRPCECGGAHGDSVRGGQSARATVVPIVQAYHRSCSARCAAAGRIRASTAAIVHRPRARAGHRSGAPVAPNG